MILLNQKVLTWIISAINGSKVMKEIRLSKSSLNSEEIKSVTSVLKNEYLGMGSDVGKFENEIKDFIGTKNDVICVSSGTAALHLALQACDLGENAEVLYPSITYVASPQSISAAKAKPVACDINLDTGFIDLKDAEKRITKNTKAIMPVHYASDSSEMNSVYEFAKKYDLRVVEDAAHSFGSLRENKRIGFKGDLVCFSFDGIKNITSGEGGAVISSDKTIAEKIKNARLLGVEGDSNKRLEGKRSWSFDVNFQGWRYHMSNVMAAIGREQLKKAITFDTKKKKLVNTYLKNLGKSKDIRLLDLNYNENFSHIFVIKVDKSKRDSLRKFLKKNFIQTGFHYTPCHLLAKFSTDYPLENAEKFAEESLTLPLHADLEIHQVEYICEKISTFLENGR